MNRLIAAFHNSARAFQHLLRHETAFGQEVALFAVAVPVGWWLSVTWRGYALLLASLIVVIIVEVLNTGIEAACDAVTDKMDDNIKIAKDCGSLAVLLSIMMAATVWGMAVVERIAGATL